VARALPQGAFDEKACSPFFNKQVLYSQLVGPMSQTLVTQVSSTSEYTSGKWPHNMQNCDVVVIP
jgi:hypothetical protein